MLFIGDSGAGKTGAIASLAAEGYKVRILDFDNGLDILRNYLTDPSSPYVKKNPRVVENVSYKTLTDPMRQVNGILMPGKAQAWIEAMKMLHDWVDGDEKLGSVTSWGPDSVLVIDSLSMLCTVAMNFHLSMNNALGKVRTQNEGRRDIGATQELVRKLLDMLYSDSIKCNIVMISHITTVNDIGGKPEEKNEAANGYPSAVGRALSPHIPRWFNSMLIARTVGVGPAAKHKIYTSSQNIGGVLVNAKNSAPLKVAAEYPLETGLADYFRAVQSDRKQAIASPTVSGQAQGKA